MDRTPPAMKHPSHPARTHYGMDWQGMSVIVAPDSDVKGMGSFPCRPGTFGVHDRPTENPLRITDVGKVCKHLCLECPLGFECRLPIDPAGRSNRADER
jgi:hypothetical protein